MEREDMSPDSRKDHAYDPSEWETMLDTDESDVERIKRNKSFKERLDPLLCKFHLSLLLLFDCTWMNLLLLLYFSMIDRH